VWWSPWNYTKVLFILTRYIPIFNMFLFVRSHLIIGTSTNLCVAIVPLEIWLLTASLIISQAVLLIRTWAVWNRDWRIGLLFVALLMGCVIFMIIENTLFSVSVTFKPPPYKEFRGCFMTDDHMSLFGEVITLASIDAVILISMTISALRTYRWGNNGKLTKLVHRDAILYYIYIILCWLASVKIVGTGINCLLIIMSALPSALHSIFTSRIIFNLRGMASPEGTTIGLHSDHLEMSGDIVFRISYDDDVELDVTSDTEVDRRSVLDDP